MVTSPPYNLGVRYRSYDDTLPRDRYLAWTSDWIAAATRVLAPDGSLFLNVGAKPTDPWTALDVAQTARKHLALQNTIHWIALVAAIAAAAATRGSFPTTRSRAATRTGRIPRRFRLASPSTPWAARPRARQVGHGPVPRPGIEMDRHYLKEAIDRVQHMLRR